jgi:hypothetical protein
MSRLFLIGSVLCILGAFLAYSTGQGIGSTLILGFMGGVFLILGLTGDKP